MKTNRSQVGALSFRLIAPVVVSLLVLSAALWYWQLPPVAPAYEVRHENLTQQIVASGRVVSASRILVGSERIGVVTRLVVREGQHVGAGDVLLMLDSDEPEAHVREGRAALERLRSSLRPQAEAALADARAQMEQAQREHARALALFERGLIATEAVEQAAEREIITRAAADGAGHRYRALSPGGVEETLLSEQLAAAEAALDKSVIRALVSGTVLVHHVEAGDLVQPGKVLLEIGRDDGTELLVHFDERHLGRFAAGQRARCVADAFPDRQFEAVLSFIAPAIDPARGTVDIRFLIPDEPVFLREDMTVSVNVETGRSDNALVIPNDALIRVSGADGAVYRLVSGRVEEVAVRLGLRGLAGTEIREGLSAGDVILADRTLTPGQRVRARMIDQPPASAGAGSGEFPRLAE